MRKIILANHLSLDGFVATPNREIDWIKLDDVMFDLVGGFTDDADTALYGRITYQLMDDYWPEAGGQPDASKHDIQHSAWYNKVDKVVLSRSMKGKDKGKTRFIADDISEEINKLKQQPGRNILMLGSRSAAQVLMKSDLIDEFWFFINPIILGQGIPMFAGDHRTNLKLEGSQTFNNGVIGLHYLLEK